MLNLHYHTHVELTSDIAIRINKSIDALIVVTNKLQSENELLKNQVAELKKAAELKEQEIKRLTQQNEVLSVAKSLSGDTESNKEAKLKINELVREIDKCISLLNN
jgi:organic radical activating enzyme